MNRIIRRIVIGAAALAGVWLLTGAGLALTPAPTFTRPAIRLPAGVVPQRKPCREEAELRCVRMRDGARMAVQLTPADSEVTVILLHGVMASSDELAPAAALLSDATGATVLRPDLRGHGRSSGRAGDVDHIGQYEEDVADLVRALRVGHPTARIVLAGHSMGGGIAMRYAARRDLPPVDGYLLFAPHLGISSPTSRTPATSAPGAEVPMKLHLKRTIGLVMLNLLRIRALNGLGTLYFNVGEGFPIHRYTYRAMAGMAPDDHRAALTADAKPLLVVVGSRDEAFDAAAYPGVAALHRGGRAVIVPGATHDGIMTSPAAFQAVRDWSPILKAALAAHPSPGHS